VLEQKGIKQGLGVLQYLLLPKTVKYINILSLVDTDLFYQI